MKAARQGNPHSWKSQVLSLCSWWMSGLFHYDPGILPASSCSQQAEDHQGCPEKPPSLILMQTPPCHPVEGDADSILSLQPPHEYNISESLALSLTWIMNHELSGCGCHYHSTPFALSSQQQIPTMSFSSAFARKYFI